MSKIRGKFMSPSISVLYSFCEITFDSVTFYGFFTDEIVDNLDLILEVSVLTSKDPLAILSLMFRDLFTSIIWEGAGFITKDPFLLRPFCLPSNLSYSCITAS